MANRASGQDNQSKRESDVNRLTALFRGRFNSVMAAELIEEHGGLQAAASFLMTGNEEDVKRRMSLSAAHMRSLREDSEKFMQVLENTHEDRQFACVDCNKAWWKRVPAHKQVSKCYSCKRKFDPVPREHEWGVGEFQCLTEGCGRVFRGFGIMGRTKSRCHGCGNQASMVQVFPPRRTDPNDDNKIRVNTHNCNGINCYRRYAGPHADQDKPPVCIHPRSPNTNRTTRVHWPSELHVSTGSTLNTFLDQGSLETRINSPAPSLETISEEDFQ